MPGYQARGFTLAELLIALAILGVIATFTIPKILQTQQKSSWNSSAKEVAASAIGALKVYQLQNSLTAATSFNDLTPFLNYVSVDTTSTIDSFQSAGSNDCSDTANLQCLRLHNGGILLHWRDNVQFGGTGTTNAIYFQIDPDGVYSGSTTGPGKSVAFWLYTTGRTRTSGDSPANAQVVEWSSLETYSSANPSAVPPWFSW